MKFLVTLDRDEDGVWIVECPSLPGCVSQGTTNDEALVRIQEAILLCLEVRAKQQTLYDIDYSACPAPEKSVLVEVEEPVDFPDPIWWDREERLAVLWERIGD